MGPLYAQGPMSLGGMMRGYGRPMGYGGYGRPMYGGYGGSSVGPPQGSYMTGAANMAGGSAVSPDQLVNNLGLGGVVTPPAQVYASAPQLGQGADTTTSAAADQASQLSGAQVGPPTGNMQADADMQARALQQRQMQAMLYNRMGGYGPAMGYGAAMARPMMGGYGGYGGYGMMFRRPQSLGQMAQIRDVMS